MKRDITFGVNYVEYDGEWYIMREIEMKTVTIKLRDYLEIEFGFSGCVDRVMYIMYVNIGFDKHYNWYVTDEDLINNSGFNYDCVLAMDHIQGLYNSCREIEFVDITVQDFNNILLLYRKINLELI